MKIASILCALILPALASVWACTCSDQWPTPTSAASITRSRAWTPERHLCSTSAAAAPPCDGALFDPLEGRDDDELLDEGVACGEAELPDEAELLDEAELPDEGEVCDEAEPPGEVLSDDAELPEDAEPSGDVEPTAVVLSEEGAEVAVCWVASTVGAESAVVVSSEENHPRCWPTIAPEIASSAITTGTTIRDGRVFARRALATISFPRGVQK